VFPLRKLALILLTGCALPACAQAVQSTLPSQGDDTTITEINDESLARLRAERLAWQAKQKSQQPKSANAAPTYAPSSATIEPSPAVVSNPAPQPQATVTVSTPAPAMRAAIAPSPAPVPQNPVVPGRKITLNLYNWTPMTKKEKARLLLDDMDSPGTQLSLAADSGFSWSTNDRPYMGPGPEGFARRLEFDEADEANGELFQAVALPILFHEDPRYLPMDRGTVKQRIGYSLSRVFVVKKDDGHFGWNKSKFFGSIASAEVANLYYPKQHDSSAIATTERVGIGIASDAAFNLFYEFWPDVARRMRLNVFFQDLVRRTLNDKLN